MSDVLRQVEECTAGNLGSTHPGFTMRTGRGASSALHIFSCLRCRIGRQRGTGLHQSFSNGPPRTMACKISMHQALQRPTSFQRNSHGGLLTHPCQPPLPESGLLRHFALPTVACRLATIAAPSPCASPRVGDPQVTTDLRFVLRPSVRRFSFPTSWL